MEPVKPQKRANLFEQSFEDFVFGSETAQAAEDLDEEFKKNHVEKDS